MSKEKVERKNRLGDPFHVLNSSGEEGLLVHVANSKHTSKAQAMELFSFCEGAFNCQPMVGLLTNSRYAYKVKAFTFSR